LRRFLPLAVFLEQEPQVIERRGPAGVQGGGLLVELDRLFPLSLFLQGTGPVIDPCCSDSFEHRRALGLVSRPSASRYCPRSSEGRYAPGPWCGGPLLGGL